ncbi:MAG: SIMPL domain-containing protein [Xanthobacteraceae bacterium]
MSDKEFDLNERRNFAMATFGLAIHKVLRRILPVGALIAAMVCVAAAQAQTAEPRSSARARVVVVGEGSVTVAPDYARIRSGVSTNAKTVKEASDTNAKLMVNIMATLVDAGIAKKDIQTSEFSIEPVYTSPTPPGGPKLSGYRVSNQINVTIHQIAQVSDVLDRLVRAGATDAGNVAFLISDREKALDQAREAAIVNARHKADLYAHASGVNLGRVAWITESSDLAPLRRRGDFEDATLAASLPKQVPIEGGEATIIARITVGFDIAQ